MCLEQPEEPRLGLELPELLSVVPVPGLMPLLEQVFIQPREVCDTLTWQGVFHPQRQLSCPWEPLSPSSPGPVKAAFHGQG